MPSAFPHNPGEDHFNLVKQKFEGVGMAMKIVMTRMIVAPTGLMPTFDMGMVMPAVATMMTLVMLVTLETLVTAVVVVMVVTLHL